MEVQLEDALRNVGQQLRSLELDPEVVPILPASGSHFAVASCAALRTLRSAPGWGVGLRRRASPRMSHPRSVLQPLGAGFRVVAPMVRARKLAALG